MNRYEIIIYWSNEDNIFIAEVPELPGCMAHGNSYEKALANAKEAINLWMDTAKEFGDPVRAKEVIRTRINTDEHGIENYLCHLRRRK